MNRIDIIVKMESLEKRKINFQNLLNDVNDRYNDKFTMGVGIDGTSYKRKYENGTTIEVDRNLFADYLERQIKSIEGEISELIGKLK